MRQPTFFFRHLTRILVVAAMMISGIGCEQTHDASPAILHEINDYEIDHSFTIKATHLTDIESRTDMLMQPRLNQYDINAALAQVFVDRGLSMVADTILRLSHADIPVTLYNPTHRIGYILLDHGRFGEGISELQLRNSNAQEVAEKQFVEKIEDGLEAYFDDPDGFFSDTVMVWDVPSVPSEKLSDLFMRGRDLPPGDTTWANEYHRLMKEHEKEHGRWVSEYSKFEEWADIDDGSDSQVEIVSQFTKEIERRLTSLPNREDHREYLEIVFMELQKKMLVDRLSARKGSSVLNDWSVSASAYIDDPVKYYGFVSRVGALSIGRLSSELRSALADQIADLSAIDSKKEWNKRSTALLDLLSVNTNNLVSGSARYHELLSDILQSVPYEKYANHYGMIQSLSDAEEISLADLEMILNLPNTYDIFIAPVSIFDDRMIYDMHEDAYQNELADIRASIAASADRDERIALQTKLLDMTDHRAQNYAEVRQVAKDKSMAALKKGMDDFISWATSLE